MNNDKVIGGIHKMKKIKNSLCHKERFRSGEKEDLMDDQPFQSKRYKFRKDQTFEYDVYEEQMLNRNLKGSCMRQSFDLESKRGILQMSDVRKTKFTKPNIPRNNVKIIDSDIKKINKKINKNDLVRKLMSFDNSYNIQNDHFVGGTCINKHTKGDDVINQDQFQNNKEVQKRCKQEEMNHPRVCKRYKKEEKSRRLKKSNIIFGSLLSRVNGNFLPNDIKKISPSYSEHEHVYDILGIFNSQTYLRLRDDSLYFIYKSYNMMDSILFSSFVSKMSEFNFINILFGYKIFKNYMTCPSAEYVNYDLLFLVSCLIASKYLDDKHIINCWVPERLIVLNILEMKILSALKYTIELDEYNLYDIMNEIFPPK